SRRDEAYESPGTVDHAFDRDPEAVRARGLESDAACTIPWREDGFEAIQVFLDPGLLDRTEELCGVITQWAAIERDLDAIRRRLDRYAAGAEIGWTMFENPRDRLSEGIVAIALTIA